MPQQFDIDPKRLEKNFLAWSRELHPDYFQLRPPDEKNLSLNLSASLNDAYATLKDPFRRAEYLLSLLGGPTASEQRVLPEDFLEEILELRMEIEEIKESGATNSQDVRELTDRLQCDRNSAMKLAAEAFSQAQSAEEDERVGNPEVLLAIRKQLNIVKYLDGLLNELGS